MAIELRITTNNDKTLEVAQEDLENTMDINEVYDYCRTLGGGWRLPHINELELIYKDLFLNNSGNFKTVKYWSDSPSSDGPTGYYLDFSNGCVDYDYMGEKLNIRLVRVIRP